MVPVSTGTDGPSDQSLTTVPDLPLTYQQSASREPLSPESRASGDSGSPPRKHRKHHLSPAQMLQSAAEISWFELLRSCGPEAGPDRPKGGRPVPLRLIAHSRGRSALLPRSCHGARAEGAVDACVTAEYVVRVRDRGQHHAGRRHFLGIDRGRDARLRPISARPSTASYREGVGRAGQVPGR
jgi:hypothetical protein